MLAAKFFDDQYFNNAYYAKVWAPIVIKGHLHSPVHNYAYCSIQVGGVPCDEMNALEMEFLFSINFSLHVNTDTYCRYFAELSSHMQPSVEMQPIPPSPETLQTLRTEQSIPLQEQKVNQSSSNTTASSASSDVQASHTSRCDQKSEGGGIQKKGSSQTHHSYVQNNGQYGGNGGINNQAVVETAVASWKIHQN